VHHWVHCAQNSFHNLPSYPPDNHHSSDDVYWRGGGQWFNKPTKVYYKHRSNPKHKLSNRQFSPDKIIPNTSRIFGQFTHSCKIPGHFRVFQAPGFPRKWSPCYEAYIQHLNTATSLLSSLIHRNKLDQKWTHSLYVILRRKTCSTRSKAHTTAMHILKLRQYWRPTDHKTLYT